MSQVKAARTCANPNCGQTFEVDPHRPGQPRKWCAPGCAVRTGTCVVCEGSFTYAGGSGRLYCSTACRNAATSGPPRTCVVPGCEGAFESRDLCKNHWQQARRYSFAIEVRQCGQCPNGFVIPTGSSVAQCGQHRTRACLQCPHPRYRAGRCRTHLQEFERCARSRRPQKDGTHRKRARRYGVAYEPIVKIEIFERDMWRCQLCRRRVRRDLAWPHPRSASLDHVVPMTQGGGHVRPNVQLAHLDCNIAKGVGGAPQQLALVG